METGQYEKEGRERQPRGSAARAGFPAAGRTGSARGSGLAWAAAATEPVGMTRPEPEPAEGALPERGPAGGGRPGPTLAALLALQPLGDLARTGWVQHGIAAPESIAAHVVGTGFVILGLGPRVRPALDVDRAIALALVHDAPEALIGDLPRAASRLLPAGAKRIAEEGAARELLPPLSALAQARFDEYCAGSSREARFARVCDRLQLGVRLVGYRRAGARGLAEFEETLLALDCGEFEPAQELRREILAALGR